MSDRFWVGQNLQNLLTLPKQELLALYPYHKWSSLKRKRATYRNQLKEIIMETQPNNSDDKTTRFLELLKRSGIDPSDVEQVTRMNVWQSAKKGEDGEWDVTDLYGMQIKPKEETAEFTPYQATPAKITPSRRKAVQRDHKSVFVFGDTQVGYRRTIDYETKEETLLELHDEKAMSVARLICRDVQPNTIVNLSDSVDLPQLGKYDADSDQHYRTLTMSFQRVHDYYAELRSDTPNADIVEVASNHNERLNKYVLRNAPELYGVQRASEASKFPILTYPYLANLEHVGVRWIGGYPSGEFVYGEEYGTPIVFRHGTESTSNGTTSAKIMHNHPETHNVHGHSHSSSETWHTNRNGEYIGSFAVGALCRIDGIVPSYHSAVNEHNQPVHHQENWDQSVLIIKDYENGRYEFTRVMIRDGRAYYNGKEYLSDV